jgi:hypothetical protein
VVVDEGGQVQIELVEVHTEMASPLTETHRSTPRKPALPSGCVAQENPAMPTLWLVLSHRPGPTANERGDRTRTGPVELRRAQRIARGRFPASRMTASRMPRRLETVIQ